LIDANAPSKTNAANNGVDVGGGSGIVSFSCVRNVMLKKKKKQDNFNKCSASLPKSQKQQNENELVFLVLSQAMPSRLNKSTRVSLGPCMLRTSCRLPGPGRVVMNIVKIASQTANVSAVCVHG